ncbi:MAG: hypothetical protein SFV22_11400 [Saprospiraceae bacterium]|nr:hypothetical protein [Saprospiraceae bacterium]
MKRKNHLSLAGGLLAFSLFYTGTIVAQTAVNLDRNSYTILYVPESKKVGPMFQPGLNSEFINRYDWNNLANPAFTPRSTDIALIASQLSNEGIGRQLMSFWWNRQSDGTFRLDTLARRGQYNAREKDRLISSKGPRGDAEVEESGLRLITRSYVVLIRPSNLRTMRDEYDQQERMARSAGSKEVIQRTQRGYVGGVEAYIFQLRYDSIVKNAFYDMWTYEDDTPEVRKQKIEAFDRYVFPLNAVRKITVNDLYSTVSTDTKNPKLDYKDLLNNRNNMANTAQNLNTSSTDEQLLQNWAEVAVNKVFEKILGKGDQIARVKGSHPIRAELGRKDGLYTEKRYIVYEEVDRGNGNIRLARKAVVRASNEIYDNRTRTDNAKPYSRFYRVGGLGRITEGMIIKERREAGIAIHALYALGQTDQIADLGAGAELNVSMLIAKAGAKRILPGLKLGLNYTISPDTIYAIGSTPIKANGSRLSVYLRKDIHFLSILRLGLSVGYGQETLTEITDEETKRSLKTSQIPLGGEVGINLLPGFNAFGQAEYILPVGPVYEGKEERSELDWEALYPKRVGLVTRVGLRYSF